MTVDSFSTGRDIITVMISLSLNFSAGTILICHWYKCYAYSRFLAYLFQPPSTPVPTVYQPVSISRHTLSSLKGVNELYHSSAYTNGTAQHVFSAANQYVALLTPLARLSWNKDKAVLEDNPLPKNSSGFYVGLYLGDSADGAYHEDIYRTLEIRRAYIESVLRGDPSLGEGLLNFCQSGKPLEIRSVLTC